MKILHITPAFIPAWHLGGVVRTVDQICRGLVRLGHEVTIFTTNSGKDRWMEVPLDRPVDMDGVEVIYFKADLTPKFAFSLGLWRACRERLKVVDLVQFYSLWWFPELVGGSLCRKYNIPYVLATTGGFTQYSLAQKAWKKWAYLSLLEYRNFRHANAIVYTAELERQQSAHMKLPAPSFIIPNGFELGEFSQLPDRFQARKDWRIPPESQVVLFLGRLHYRKGLDFLIQAVAALKDKLPNLLLILAGPDDGVEATLRNLADQVGINSRVLFTGYVSPEKRNSLFSAADLCVLATHPGENFGNAAVEAMLAGLPLLVSEHVGISREVQTDGAGVVVPLQVEPLAQALQQMLADPEKLKAMGQIAAAAARRRYDINIVSRMMAMAYEDILLGRRSPGLSWSDS